MLVQAEILRGGRRRHGNGARGFPRRCKPVCELGCGHADRFGSARTGISGRRFGRTTNVERGRGAGDAVARRRLHMHCMLARHAQRRCVPRYRGPFRPASISPAKVRSRGSQVPRPRHVRLSASAVRRQPAQRRSRRVPTLSRRASKPQRACGPETVRFLPVCAQSSRTFDTHTDQNRPRRPMNTSFDDKRAFSCSSRAFTRLTNVLKPVSTLPMST
jgi:hypothetical protein